MKIQRLKAKIPGFIGHLRDYEYAQNSIRSYQKDIAALFDYLDTIDGDLKKEHLIAYKGNLVYRLKPVSVNRALAAINKFLKYAGLDDFVLKTLKIQEQTTAQNELTEKEFELLIKTAYQIGKTKIALIMLTIACTGIRIGELQFITAEAVQNGKAVVSNKGTIRTVIIQSDLQYQLVMYCKKCGVKGGTVFTGSRSNPISRSYVAGEMKRIASKCGVDPFKVFPHNLRHYFARRFLECGNPLCDLADALGHKNINTTRRYLKTSVEVKQRQLSKLKIMRNWHENYGTLLHRVM